MLFRLTLIAPLCCLSVASAQDELFIAHDASGRLLLDISEPPIFDVPLSADPAFPGWVTDDPSFITLPESIPPQGLFALDPAAELSLQLLTVDPRLRILNPVTFAPIEPGSVVYFGHPVFNAVLLWNIPAATNEPLEVTLRLIDTGTTGYFTSPDYTLAFTTIPGPGWVSSSPMLIALAATRRRRDANPK